MDTFVSVIIPTYGGNDSLKRAIDSVLLQDYSLFEIIVVDDNNPDSKERAITETIMNEYDENDKVVYLRHNKNKNGSAARNTGANVAKGEYFTFLDDDDIYLQGKIRKEAEYLDRELDYEAVYCWRKESDKVVGSELIGDLSASLLDLSFTPCTPSLMLRRSSYFAINGFDESYNRHQDFEFLLRFFQSYKIGVLREPLIEIIGNSVDNQIRGEKAVELKKKFLETFSENIDRIDREHKNFKKCVYAKHYGSLMVKLLRYGKIGLAVKVYLSDAYKGGSRFWKEFFYQIKLILDKRFAFLCDR